MNVKIKKGKVIQKNFAVFVIMTCFFLLLPFTSHADREQTVDILVQEGDTLIDICEKYLEIPSKWREIARLNQLDNPDLIYPGTKLTIPE